MRTDRLRMNQLSPEGLAWYLDYLAAMDRKDVAAYGGFLAEACELRINSAPPTIGKPAILQALGAYWQSFGSIEHDLENIYGDDRRFALEALNHYTRLDGKPVTLRAVACTDRDAAGLAASVRLYTDTAPLFAAG